VRVLQGLKRIDHIGVVAEDLPFASPPQRSGAYPSVWMQASTSAGIMFQFAERDPS
jgi:hypothetical protein